MKNNKFLVTTEEGKEVTMEYPEVLSMVDFTPLLERVEQEQPELLEGLIRLFEKMDVEEFQQYINTLSSIRRHEKDLLMITRTARHKSIIEMKFLNLIKECFEVSMVRIFCEA